MKTAPGLRALRRANTFRLPIFGPGSGTWAEFPRSETPFIRFSKFTAAKRKLRMSRKSPRLFLRLLSRWSIRERTQPAAPAQKTEQHLEKALDSISVSEWKRLDAFVRGEPAMLVNSQ